jgi:hypothetical protein
VGMGEKLNRAAYCISIVRASRWRSGNAGPWAGWCWVAIGRWYSRGFRDEMLIEATEVSKVH